MTWRCNLRCGFCYTDSPRHTLARTADLSEEAWLGVVDDALALGIVEAVVTGGEPLLRRDLTLAVVERLAGAGVGVVLNTNGWFVDDDIADRLAALPGLRVFVSIDGAAPVVHDAARGVTGSWRRAVRAAHLLLERGVEVQVVHVVTPDNLEHLPSFLSGMALLGVGGVALAPVQPMGAAGRSARWTVDRRDIEGVVRTFRGTHGDALPVRVRGDVSYGLETYASRVPRALLVRPNGKVRTESSNPFVFGDAIEDGLSECWAQIRRRWDDPAVTRWARESGGRKLHRASLVAYRDGDVDVGGGARTAALPADAAAPAAVGQPDLTPEDLADARTELTRLAASRRYRLGDVRWSDDVDGARLVRIRWSGSTMRLNRTAGAVMDACTDGTIADATDRLIRSYPDEDPERLRRDASVSLRRLLDAGVVRPAPRRVS